VLLLRHRVVHHRKHRQAGQHGERLELLERRESVIGQHEVLEVREGAAEVLGDTVDLVVVENEQLGARKHRQALELAYLVIREV